eukprot:TRINITY_DN6523_c0_g1_i1.p1 TRINITY_DN6523_c0_g1~~TRINITY_DN6523_c0_g1_i1.p1  ORF type:complete len:237 (-),score=63.25 TRINITY_DN6523_c0_g1_i1:9-719(-)
MGNKLKESAAMEAAANGQIKMLEHLKGKGISFKTSVSVAAASSNQLKVLEYLDNEGCVLNEETFEAAAGGGDVEMLKFLKRKKCKWNEKASHMAVFKKRLEQIRWIVENGLPIHRDILSNSLRSGDSEIFKLIRERQDPRSVYNTGHLSYAALGGNIDSMIYVMERGATFNNIVSGSAASAGHIHVLKWLREQNYISNFTWENSGKMAYSYSQFATMEWLRDNGCDGFQDTMFPAS